VIRIFKHELIQDQLSDAELTELVNDFRSYKQSGVVPDTFGRDAPYNHVNSLPLIKSEEVAHIHLPDDGTPWAI